MIKVLFILSLTLVLASSNSLLQGFRPFSKLFPTENRSLINAIASNDGIVYLNNFYGYGFDADVDLSTSTTPNPTSDYFPFNVQMRLALYSSETILFDSTNCRFKSFFCGNVWTGCKAKTYDTASLSYINFNATGYRAQTSATIDYNYWSLSQPVLIANNCSKAIIYSQYEKVYGIIGMGFSGGAKNNFKNTNMFAIYIDPTANNSQVHFKTDLRGFAKGTQPEAILNTTADWQLPGLLYLAFGQYSYTIYDYSLLFDMNTENILLPIPFYEKIVLDHFRNYGVDCPNNVFSSVSCAYNGEIRLLPNITFTYGSQKIHIPPQIYVKNGFNTSIQTNITLAITVSSPKYQIRDTYVDAQYLDYIVLGHSFMKHFYTVFDVNNQSISLYSVKPPGKEENAPESNGSRIYWIMFSLVFIISCCCKCCCTNKGKRNTTNYEPQRPLMNPQPTFGVGGAPAIQQTKNETLVVFFPIKKPGPTFPIANQAPVNDPSYYAPNYQDYHPQMPDAQPRDPQNYNNYQY